MKYIPLCISLFLFTSCSMNGADTRDTRITELEKQVQELKIENANLKENQSLINAGGIPTEMQTTQPSGGSTVVNPLFPEGTTFEETDSTSCMRKAYTDYINAGTKQCKILGYTDEQIRKDACQLETSFINALKKKKTDDEGKCGPQ